MSRKHKQIPIELKLPPPLAGTCCTTGALEAGCWRRRRRYTSVCIYEYIMYIRKCNVYTSNTSKRSFRGMILKALLPHQSLQPFWHAPRQIATKVLRKNRLHILPARAARFRCSKARTVSTAAPPPSHAGPGSQLRKPCLKSARWKRPEKRQHKGRARRLNCRPADCAVNARTIRVLTSLDQSDSHVTSRRPAANAISVRRSCFMAPRYHLVRKLIGSGIQLRRIISACQLVRVFHCALAYGRFRTLHKLDENIDVSCGLLQRDHLRCGQIRQHLPARIFAAGALKSSGQDSGVRSYVAADPPHRPLQQQLAGRHMQSARHFYQHLGWLPMHDRLSKLPLKAANSVRGWILIMRHRVHRGWLWRARCWDSVG